MAHNMALSGLLRLPVAFSRKLSNDTFAVGRNVIYECV